ncbi:hypothetical protein ACFIOY_29510 [Bradyrhizobium sp. TZ2]
MPAEDPARGPVCIGVGTIGGMFHRPDLNLIEQFFAKFKHWLRKAEKRTIEAVYDAVGPILQTVTADECTNYFVNAGYHQT